MSDRQSRPEDGEALRRAAATRSGTALGIGLRGRRRALRALDTVGAESLDAVLDLLRAEKRRARVRRRILLWGLAVCVLGAVAVAVLGHASHVNINPSGLWIVAVSAVVGRRLQRKAVRRLTEFGDLRCVGFLADALHDRDRSLRPLAMARLTELLPQMKHSDAGLMSEEQKLSLYKAVRLEEARPPRVEEAQFLVAALGALEQIGDERALPYVEGIAQQAPRSAEEHRVVTAASDSLPALQQRVQNQREAARLLRPAAAPAEGADTLLRPTYGPGETDPALLLRASEAPDREE